MRTHADLIKAWNRTLSIEKTAEITGYTPKTCIFLVKELRKRGFQLKKRQRESFADRWKSRVAKRRSGCWEWTGGCFPNGYGRIRFPKKSARSAHRASWEINFGDIPDGMYVLHRCDNPKCVNPSHLFLGTPQDNMTDMINKGRQGKNRGLECWNAKLTPRAVRDIRRMYATGRYTQLALANIYGVEHGTICAVVKRRAWKHVS